MGIKHHQWEGLLLLDRMQLDIEHKIRKMPGLKSILLTGICKDALMALILAFRLKKRFSLSSPRRLGMSLAA